MELTHMSLFTGIGGIDLAAEWAGFKTVGQCEYADFPTKVLEKHWPDVERWKDVNDFTAESFWRRTGFKSVTVLSGGFPCQPHSLAGKRGASDDERDLWPEFRRVIGEIRPKWVVAENVRGLLSSENGQFFRGILRDFANLGYDVGWCTICAAWVGAVHRRERMAIVAYSNSNRQQGWGVENKSCISRELFASLFTHTMYGTEQENNISTPYVCRVADGIPNKLDRIKSLGNAVVPYQFYPILNTIFTIETNLFTKGEQHE